MPRIATGARWYIVLDRIALGVFIIAIALGLGLGGTGSSVVRLCIQGFLLLSGLLFAAGMMADRRWRIVPSVFWLFPMMLLFWTGVQLFAPVANSIQTAGGANIIGSNATWNRFATLEAGLWISVLLLAALGSAHMLRSVGRIKGFVAVFTAIVLMIGAVGLMQQLMGSTTYLGLYSADDKRVSVAARDWVGSQTTIGLRRVQPNQPWSTSEQKSEPGNPAQSIWFVPTIKTARFGSYLDPSDWASAAGLIVPLAWASGVIYLRRRTAATDQGWDYDAPRGWLFILASAGLATAACAGSLIAAPLALLGALFVLIVMTGRGERGLLLKSGATLFGLVLLCTVCTLVFAGGFDTVSSSFKRWYFDSVAIARIGFDHLWFGCGFGSLPDVWPLYRPTENPAAGSSLLAMIVESGVVIAVLGCMFVLFAIIRWVRIAPILPEETRIIFAGIGASLVAWLIWATFTPGGDSPMVLLAAAVLAGCLIRGLASVPRMTEGATS